jgi:4a-hydroxytetrahydrobiopterin dehydratase
MLVLFYRNHAKGELFMTKLSEMKCVPCRSNEPPLTEEQIEALKPQVAQWEIIERAGINRLKREFKFKNFVQALEFTNQVGELAEQQDHHPALLTEWGKTTVTWWTHAIKGLHKNDFVMAAKTDQLSE